LAVVWTFVFFINLSNQNFWNRNISKIIKYFSIIISPFILAFQIISFTIIAAVVSGKFSFNEVIILFNNHDYRYAYYSEVQILKSYFFWTIVTVLVLYLSKEIYKNSEKVTAKIDFLSLVIVVFLHCFFLISIFVKGFYVQHPIFILISIISLLFYLFITFAPFYRNKKSRIS